MPELSIVFPLYPATRELAQMAIAAYELFNRSLATPDPEWVLICNGGHVDWLGDLPDQMSTTVVDSNPLGYAGAVNLGLRMSHGDYIAVVSNDVLSITDAWDRILMDVLLTHAINGRGIVSPGYIGVDSEGPWVAQTHLWSCVAVFMMTRSVVQTVGLLDESYRMWVDDQDYLYRCEQAGVSVLKTGKVMLNHIGGATLHLDPQWQEKERESKQLFFQKHGVHVDQWRYQSHE